MWTAVHLAMAATMMAVGTFAACCAMLLQLPALAKLLTKTVPATRFGGKSEVSFSADRF